MTPQTARIVAGFLVAPDHPRYGQQAVVATGLPRGTVYPILRRLEQCGWLAAEDEDSAAARRLRRPPRVYYRLTDTGRQLGRAALAELAPHLRALTQWTDTALGMRAAG